jgi:hypothetical protein
MKLNKVVFIIAFFFANNIFAQNSATEIETRDGIHFITNTINYPITGVYTFQDAEPIVDLNANGTGIYQLHEQPKREMIWGIECNENGEPIFKKGYDSAEYTLYFKYTSLENEGDKDWKKVEFSIHFNSLKMYINGERAKSFVYNEEK